MLPNKKIKLKRGRPNIAVLMATYNGMSWLNSQLESILSQSGVDVTLFVSDDSSSDGTFEYANKLALIDQRIVVLQRKERMGSAGKNFYRLLLDVDMSGFDYVAFADQDDIWNLDKLSSHVALIKKSRAEAVSSNVLAFWPDGNEKLIIKSQPQQSYDFLFESAGPGCTFLMTPWLVNEVKRQLIVKGVAKEVDLHDWLTYAICRAHNKTWVIDAKPSMNYRQHQANVVGANSGLKPALARLKKINSGWYRQQVALISRVVASINPNESFISFLKVIQHKTFTNQLRLIVYALSGRRKLSDRLVLLFSIIFFVF